MSSLQYYLVSKDMKVYNDLDSYILGSFWSCCIIAQAPYFTEGNCLCAPWSLPWCPWNASVEIFNFLIGCPFTTEKLPWCPYPFKNKAYMPDGNTVIGKIWSFSSNDGKLGYRGWTWRKVQLLYKWPLCWGLSFVLLVILGDSIHPFTLHTDVGLGIIH